MFPSRFWRRDSTRAKRDDDFVPSTSLPTWKSARMPRRKAIVRFSALALLLCLAFLYLHDSRSSLGARRPSFDDGPDDDLDDRSIKFPRLSGSLPLSSTTRSRNVLFAAASLASAAMLLPLACQMGLERHNSVHFALMGPSRIPMSDLLSVNGIDKACLITTHDARPDKADSSTDRRLMMAVSRSIRYIDSYMRPRAILIDSTSSEHDFLARGVLEALTTVQSALIQLPEKPESRLSWIAKLDAMALSAWNKVRFDILIYSPRTGTGNLKRLLRSLADADLLGHSPPHLTVELPPTIEEALDNFLADYQWPRPVAGQQPVPQLLSLRRRIVRRRSTEEQSSVRFLESFWPPDPEHAHVLVLSPNTQVTPQFFHYVKYSILHHRYSATAFRQDLDAKIMAMSFTVPSVSIDGTSAFTPPQTLPNGEDAQQSSSFLWQAPASDAVLFPGERWVELHHYITQVLDSQQEASSSPALLATKQVSKNQPAWVEYVLQLSRLRSYFTLYPSQETGLTLVGVHNDLPSKPEEYDDGKSRSEMKKQKAVSDPTRGLFDPVAPDDMLLTLPHHGQHPLANQLPLLSWDGKQKSLSALRDEAEEYVNEFRRQVGHCGEQEIKSMLPPDKTAKDLFCKASK